jgi:hypothetical protein
MGTNYYLQKKINDEGRRRDIHICKTSHGWYPHLQGYKNEYDDNPIITSWFDWKTFLRAEVKRNEGLIFNEYDELLTLEEFIEMIENWQFLGDTSDWANPFNYPTKDINPYSISHEIREEWLDPQGYWLSSREFS